MRGCRKNPKKESPRSPAKVLEDERGLLLTTRRSLKNQPSPHRPHMVAKRLWDDGENDQGRYEEAKSVK
jgi:hypothetical protein